MSIGIGLRRNLGRALLAGVLMLGLAACTEGAPILDPEPTDPPSFEPVDYLAPGACLGQTGQTDERGDVPITEDAVVDCEEPHIYEVTGVVPIPWSYFEAGEPTRQEYSRTLEAIDGKTPNTYQFKLSAWAEVVCEGSTQKAMGLDQLEVDGDRALRARLEPFDRRSSTVARVEPFDAWTSEPRLVCVRRYHALSGEPMTPPARSVTRFQTSSFVTPDYPLASRWCTTKSGNSTDCDEPHFAENTISFNATATLGEDDVAALREARENDDPEVLAEWQQKLDDICTGTHNMIVGSDWDSQNLMGKASFGIGWTSETTQPRLLCSVTSAQPDSRDLPAGSVFGLGDTIVETVPRD